MTEDPHTTTDQRPPWPEELEATVIAIEPAPGPGEILHRNQESSSSQGDSSIDTLQEGSDTLPLEELGGGTSQDVGQDEFEDSMMISSLEVYESMMLLDLENASTPTRYFFFIEGVGDDRITYQGTNQSYAPPVQLGEQYAREFRVETYGGSYTPHYAIVCFLLDHNTPGIKSITIMDQEISLDSAPRVDLPGQLSLFRVLLRKQITGHDFLTLASHKEDSELASVMLCFVEYYTTMPDRSLYYCVLPWIPPPRWSFNVCHSDSSQQGGQQFPVDIKTIAVSSSGSHVATLSSTGTNLYLDLWKLDIGAMDPNATRPYPATTSVAHRCVGPGDGNGGHTQISVSWDGSQVALYAGYETCVAPFQLFTFDNHNDHMGIGPHLGQGSQLPNILSRSTRHSRCHTLVLFQGDARFTNLATPNWNDDTERFIACDGQNFCVFTTAGEWKMHYCIQISSGLAWRMSYNTIHTAAQGVFVSCQTPYQLSVWDLASGKRLYFIDSTHEILYYSVSSDGRTIAVATMNTLFQYSADSGVLFQRSSLPYLFIEGFLKGDTQFYAREIQTSHEFWIVDANNHSRQRKILLPNWLPPSICDINPSRQWQGACTHSTLVACHHGSALEVSFIEDVTSELDVEPLCIAECSSEGHELLELRGELELPLPGRVCKLRTGNDGDSRKLVVDIKFDDGQSNRLWLLATSFYFVEKTSRIVMVRLSDQNIRCSVWRLPQSSDKELEMEFYWSKNLTFFQQAILELGWANDSNRRYSVRSCCHERTLTLNIDGNAIQLSEGKGWAPGLVGTFSYSMSYLFYIDQLGSEDASKAAFRYMYSHINKYPMPKEHLNSIMSSICMYWTSKNHDCFKKGLSKLLQIRSENSWVPREVYSNGSNPVGIMLKKAQKEPQALAAIRLLIDHCAKMARNEKDITYILFLLECLDDLVLQYPDLALRATRAFAYVKWIDRAIITNNCKITHPPTLRPIWKSSPPKIYQCKNPILQPHYTKENPDPLNTDFQEDVFVAPVNLLWTFVQNPRNQCTEHPEINPGLLMTWVKTIYHLVFMHLNPFSHVYIRPRNYSLEVLDNPAVEAVVLYKWNTFAFGLWVARFVVQCIYYLLIVVAAFVQVYCNDKDMLLGVFVTIIVFSCLFLWTELLQWRESRFCSTLKKDAIGQWVQESPLPETRAGPLESENEVPSAERTKPLYFRSTFNILDLSLYFYALGTSIHQIVNIKRTTVLNGVTADFSFCIVLVLLHLLAELRISKTMCKYITIVFRTLREIKVFFIVFVASVLFFAIAILHVLYGRGNNAWEQPDVYMPINYFGAIVTVYLMMGGRYDPLADDLFSAGEKAAQNVLGSPTNVDGAADESKPMYKNWELQVMVMTYYTFSSILMLNILIALINVAFVKADESWRQVWLEHRLRYVESAENISYHIPGFREKFDWFPKMIFFTATPYQVKQYRRRIAKKDEEILFFEDKDGSLQGPELIHSSEDEHFHESRTYLVSKMSGMEEKFSKQSQDQQETITTRLKEQNTQISNLHRSAETSHSDLMELKNDADGLKSQMSRLLTDNSDIKEGMLETRGEVVGLKGEMSELRAGLLEMRQDMRDIQDALAVLLRLQKPE